ncbi:unnamed protein product [Soboliphyme baturini]|uniref:PH domain-containing protein n=1 Tax=Soboliphyme baturini TaxID=241478 RepID=A0A183IEA3_9BILA|nr:unnamed protein product [Soboliphyme baturini]
MPSKLPSTKKQRASFVTAKLLDGRAGVKAGLQLDDTNLSVALCEEKYVLELLGQESEKLEKRGKGRSAFERELFFYDAMTGLSLQKS